MDAINMKEELLKLWEEYLEYLKETKPARYGDDYENIAAFMMWIKRDFV